MLMRKWETKRHQKFHFSLVYLEGVNIHRCGLWLRKRGTQAFSSTFQEEEIGESCMYKPDDRRTYARSGDISSLSFKLKVTEDLTGQAACQLHFCVCAMILQHISFVFQEKMWLTDGTVK